MRESWTGWSRLSVNNIRKEATTFLVDKGKSHGTDLGH